MNRIILFYNYNCVERKVTDTAPYEGLPNVAINPDTVGLEQRKVRRQYWKLYKGEVVEKTSEEKKIVDDWHEANIQTNPDVIEVVKEVIKEIRIPVEIEKEVIRVELKEVPVEIIKLQTIYKTPIYNWVIMLMQIIFIIIVLLGVFK